jgi:hypothetical protein
MIKKRYWLTPKNEYEKLNKEFKFDFDPCPYPLPKKYDGLKINWGKSNYVNPPFRKEDSKHGIGMTAFVHKGIEEYKKGKQVVFILPVYAHINLLLEAGAKIRSAGRFPFLDVNTKKPSTHPHPAAFFILKPNL